MGFSSWIIRFIEYSNELYAGPLSLFGVFLFYFGNAFFIAKYYIKCLKIRKVYECCVSK